MAKRNADLPLDVVWPRLIAIADEMATTMFRTAFSHDVVEVHDMYLCRTIVCFLITNFSLRVL